MAVKESVANPVAWDKKVVLAEMDVQVVMEKEVA